MLYRQALSAAVHLQPATLPEPTAPCFLRTSSVSSTQGRSIIAADSTGTCNRRCSSGSRPIKKGDPNKGAKEIAKAVGLQPQGPGNYESTAQVVMYNPTAFRRRKGVTEFIDITHPFKPNFSDNFHERITKDPRVFARVQGSMVAWMEAAIIGKSKIPFRKTQPPGV